MISSWSCYGSFCYKNFIIWLFEREKFVESSSEFERSCYLLTFCNHQYNNSKYLIVTQSATQQLSLSGSNLTNSLKGDQN